ncbi:hypothetical protein OG762_46535 [Streptomyces sp. NBC_01136]|uniref:hypothetical protein n=1 Tax=unclassified Streptomyces TaxID=2593676 RepID=UPI00324BCEC5|nr:hypothetical protein OG762_00090 [Streptomyces sp. NBC_01136]WST81231.1 hypothetical protein OG762_46535 [Streptomyces sp. NBC_01136]
MRCTSRQPPAASSTIGTQPELSAQKNHRSPSRDEQPDPAASPQAGPVRQEKSGTSRFPSKSCQSRYVCPDTPTAISTWP